MHAPSVTTWVLWVCIAAQLCVAAGSWRNGARYRRGIKGQGLAYGALAVIAGPPDGPPDLDGMDADGLRSIAEFHTAAARAALAAAGVDYHLHMDGQNRVTVHILRTPGDTRATRRWRRSLPPMREGPPPGPMGPEDDPEWHA